MPIHHTVRPGDSVAKLAEQHGLFVETIWGDAANAELRARRPDMNVLMPSDVLVIPDKREKRVSVASGARHRFRRKGVPAKYRLQIIVHDRPLANASYVLVIDGAVIEGRTNAEGILEECVSPLAKRGELVVGPDRLRFLIEFGHLNPASDLTGVQQRLRNLGYTIEDPDGELGESTAEALRTFQRRTGIAETGSVDPETSAQLDAVHARPGLLAADEPTPAER